MVNEELSQKIRQLIDPILKEYSVEVVEFIYRREGSKMALRLLADKLGGITLEDCSQLNQRIGTLLDEADLIQERYFLEVSSPGLDRPLATKRDFQRNIGRLVRMTVVGPSEKNITLAGKIKNVDIDSVEVETKKGLLKVVKLDQIMKAKLEIKP